MADNDLARALLPRQGASRPRLVHRLVPVLLLAGLAACGRGEPVTLPESGISLALAEHRQATLSDVRYRFTLAIPADLAAPVTGLAEIGFHWRDAGGRDLVVDFKDPEQRVRGVRVNGRSVEPRFAADHVIIPAEILAPGANRIVLEIIAGDEALNRNPGFLYTLFVPDRAHFSLPVFDQPGLKGRVAWELLVPRGWSALANGSRLEQSRVETTGGGDTGSDRIVFAESEPLPTYLFAFAAGEFDTVRRERDGRTMEMLHRETDADKLARNVDEIFDLHATALGWLETYTGIDYPFQTFGFVLIPSFQYGGMEHPGAITYRASSLLLEENATEAQQLDRASLIAHETAHMWFGDLVTMAWFDDVWTKEVFANFMAARIVHPSFPDVDHDLRFLLAHHPRAYAVDRTRGANPIRQSLENLNQAGTLYGAIIYQKAPVVMQQLEEMLGEDAFREGMREYLNRFAYGNATWPDLIEILDALHPADLAAWSAVWVEEPGRPTVTVERLPPDMRAVAPGGPAGAVGTLTSERLAIRQSDPRGRDRIWPQRLHLALFTETGPAGVEVMGIAPVELDEPEHVVRLPTGEGLPTHVLPNGGGAEYGLFRPDEASLAFLVERGLALPEPVLRGTAWLTLYDLMLEARVTPETLLSAGLDALSGEPAEQLVSRMLADMSQTYWRFLSAGGRQAWAPRLEVAIWSAMEDSDTRTRRATFFAAYVDLATTPAAVARLERLWAGEEAPPGLTLSLEDRISLARALALREVDGWQAILEAQAAELDNPDRLAQFRFVLDSLDADPGVRRSFFAALKDPANRAREPWVLEGLDNLHHPLRAAASVELVLPALEMLEEIQRTGDIFFPTGWMASTLTGHNTPEVVDIVDRFLAARPDYPPRLAQKILQASDMVERAARVIKRESG